MLFRSNFRGYKGAQSYPSRTKDVDSRNALSRTTPSRARVVALTSNERGAQVPATQGA